MADKPIHFDLAKAEAAARQAFAEFTPSDQLTSQIAHRAQEVHIQWMLFILSEMNRGTYMNDLVAAMGHIITSMLLNVDNKIGGTAPPSWGILANVVDLLEEGPSDGKEVGLPGVTGGRA